ncbi:DUF3703 domain-containing protein [Myxococcus xanthus]|uniref:DUF3703 domain-containing protein n=1 Tax=Myxococcus xanthus TaxID=34 RepID=A0A7Y4MTV3_MYXXA|nr:DUF3703 domain-containing protein [Myxococcus xanthus]NOJ82019.1 DUF3703 domain-containing protein [Myxococcus xanthus]NOJ89443.1 DUF3703 domain-containing protein [Myxococcus xanthus]
MKPTLQAHFKTELEEASTSEARGDYQQAWRSLERAHILSQAHTWPHLRVYGLMFAFAWRRRNLRELAGQVPRLLLAAPGSWLGRAPLGNTGGANVGIFTPMPIPSDIQPILREAAPELAKEGPTSTSPHE